MTIKEIAEEYNKMKEEDENAITPITIESAEFVEKVLKENKLTGYTIVPSPMGEICFEWDTKKPISLGICVNDEEYACIERLDHRIGGDFYMEAFNLKNEEEVDQFVAMLSELIHE